MAFYLTRFSYTPTSPNTKPGMAYPLLPPSSPVFGRTFRTKTTFCITIFPHSVAVSGSPFTRNSSPKCSSEGDRKSQMSG